MPAGRGEALGEGDSLAGKEDREVTVGVTGAVPIPMVLSAVGIGARVFVGSTNLQERGRANKRKRASLSRHAKPRRRLRGFPPGLASLVFEELGPEKSTVYFYGVGCASGGEALTPRNRPVELASSHAPLKCSQV